jgi:hypothetical protein
MTICAILAMSYSLNFIVINQDDLFIRMNKYNLLVYSKLASNI